MRQSMWREARRGLLTVATVGLMTGIALTGEARAGGGTVYSDNFTSGIDFTVNDPFWLDNTRANGFITTTTNTSAIFPGFPGDFGTEINSGVGGSGNFLFDGTYNYNGPNDPNIPVGHDEFYISSSFSVSANTLYAVSFYTTSANGIAPPSIQPEIDGTLLGSPVSPVGDWASNGWQQFTFYWNSGSNTSASLILHDYTTTTTGNDFGITNISVSSVPEPSAFALAVVGAAGILACGWMRRKAGNRRRPAA
jgi:hypothetical protein